MGRRVISKQTQHLAGYCLGFDDFRRISVRQLQRERAGMQGKTAKGKISHQVVYGPRRAVAGIADNRMAGELSLIHI